MKTIGIIGGSGLYRLEEFEYVTSHKLNTPWGNPSDEIIEYSFCTPLPMYSSLASSQLLHSDMVIYTLIGQLLSFLALYD